MCVCCLSVCLSQQWPSGCHLIISSSHLSVQCSNTDNLSHSQSTMHTYRHRHRLSDTYSTSLTSVGIRDFLLKLLLVMTMPMLPSFLTLLGDDLQILFLSLWLDVRSLSTLDVALSCHRLRPCWMTLLQCLRSPAYDRTLPRGHKGSGGEGISMMSVMLVS